jgi:hypothetical protein
VAKPVSIDALTGTAAATDWSTTPHLVPDHVVDLVADCVGVTALGSRRGEIRASARQLGHTVRAGRQTVLGSPQGWPATTAELLTVAVRSEGVVTVDPYPFGRDGLGGGGGL